MKRLFIGKERLRKNRVVREGRGEEVVFFSISKHLLKNKNGKDDLLFVSRLYITEVFVLFILTCNVSKLFNHFVGSGIKISKDHNNLK